MSLFADIQVDRALFRVDLSFSAEPGETIGLVGPNGAGKSTIVGSLAGLIPLEKGRIVLDAAVLDDAAGNRVPSGRRSVGVVFQDLRLFPHLSALDNVAFGLRARGENATAGRDAARAALERFGLGARSSARPDELSGGEAQCVALARALIRAPRLLLLDEPMAALDAGARRRVRSILRDVLAEHSGMALIVSHDPVDVMTLADRIVVMENGSCVQQGPPAEIRRRPLSAYASELVGVNVFRGELAPLEQGAAKLSTSDGDIIVATRQTDSAGPVLATLKPSDVSIHTRRPVGSARNVVEGPISAIDMGNRARVTVAGHPTIVAELTPGSLSALDLTKGQIVFASFKATEVNMTRD